jgi:hypothetical protein
MEWEDKGKMIALGNKQSESDESKKEYQDFILSQVDNFDGQAWDMFSQITHIDPVEMKNDVKFWEQVYFRMKNVDCNDQKFGLRSGFRIAIIQTICEDELLLKTDI